MTASIIQPGTQEHRHALDLFGLTPIIFQEIGDRILGEYNQATPNDAKAAAGSYAYFAAIRALRDFLCPEGWQHHREGNIEMVLGPSSQFAITASSGDDNTGRNGIEPKTKNHKGSQTSNLVFKNRNQGELFPEMVLADPPYDPDRTPTWFLLYHIDLAKNEIRMELSLPISIDFYTFRINQWRKRIFLPSGNLGGTPINKATQPELYSDFDIEIKRKANE
ncbi:MAG: hypothetical protein M0P74_00915 [Syntrophales bacterium]|jgi:hypothetical protein|nr:hypothetical protein [Syntrophales bacterium]